MKEMETEMINPIDQVFANNIADIENHEAGSDARKGLLEENKLYHQIRKDEVNACLEQMRIDLDRDRLDFEKEKQKQENDNKRIDLIGKIAIGVCSLVAGCIIAFSEMDLEENGSNRSKAAQKFGQFFKPWK